MEKILCVDDEPNVLEAFRRTLRKDFNLFTASSGEEGLAVLRESGPFAVVVSDQRMPGMGGIAFLSAVRASAPDTVRVMLTGDSDKQTAIDAVNEGNIFRFLSKPCPPETLIKTLHAALNQHRLITAEKSLLEDTVKGAIKMLVGILGMTNPLAFSRASRIKDHVAKMAIALELPDLWQYEVAAMLSQLGYVTLPGDLVEKVLGGESLTLTEMEMVSGLPSLTGELVAHIPRFEAVAEMIIQQQMPAKYWADCTAHEPECCTIGTGAQLLKIAVDFETLLAHGMSCEDAIASLAKRPEVYCPRQVGALRCGMASAEESPALPIEIGELTNGMRIAEDVHDLDGALIVRRGDEVTDTMRQRLLNYSCLGRIPATVFVLAG